MYKLRELEKRDLERINKWRNNPELIALLGAPFRFINLNVDEKWFEQYMLGRNNAVRCAIVDEENDEILGLVSLVNIDYINQIAEFHIMIGEYANRRKGIGSFAVKKILWHAFNNLNLRRIELSVLETNEIAYQFYEKMGFIKEGCKRQAVYKNGKFIDLWQYGILKSEYNNIKLRHNRSGGVKHTLNIKIVA